MSVSKVKKAHVVLLHFPDGLASHENFDNLLMFANKDIEEASKKHKSRTGWMRSSVRNYTVGQMANLRRWQGSGIINLRTRSVKDPKLKLVAGKAYGKLDDGFEGEQIGLNITDLMYQQLVNALPYINALQRSYGSSDIEYENIGQLVRGVVFDNLLALQAAVDEEELRLGEDDLEDIDPEPEEPETKA